MHLIYGLKFQIKCHRGIFLTIFVPAIQAEQTNEPGIPIYSTGARCEGVHEAARHMTQDGYTACAPSSAQERGGGGCILRCNHNAKARGKILQGVS